LASFEKTKELTDHFIAVSRAVKDNLVKNHQVAKDKISMVYGFIPIENFSPEELAQKKRKIFEQLGFPPDAFVVGASGTLYWRKAPDIFLQIAQRVYQKNPDVPIYFLWVGGAAKGDFRFYELNHDVEKFGLRQRVRFLEHQPDPIDYFAAFDAFAMTSREDPFPLVCLETAALGKPQICFDEAGGMPEFVENDCGFVVPYLDAESFANKIFALYSDRQLTESFGNNAAQKVRKWHNIEIAAPKILEIIKERGNF
jgi:glycosyltransferase involved in cell wall biosynthesis